VERLLRVPSEGDDRVDRSRANRIEELVPPLQLLRLLEELLRLNPVARVQGVGERVDAEVRLREAELLEEALDALPRVADERPVRDPLRRAGIRRDAQEARGAVEPSPVEDRPPVRP